MFAGIDTSKGVFDFALVKGNKVFTQKKFSNIQKGFDQVKADLQDAQLVTIEATGPYYLRLALDLYNDNIPVAVINPLVIRRFSQMRMSRAKTDKKDAFLIAQFGEYEKPALWQPPEQFMLHLQQLDTYMEGLQKRRTAVKNQLHSFEVSGQLDQLLREELEEEIEVYNRKLTSIEEQITQIMEREHARLLNVLKSIPGIGPKSAYVMILVTNAFKNFDHYKQVISYFGLAPRIYESGKSVRGKASICKMGMARVRKTLYMAARSAIHCNRACKQLYERLRAKGKSHRLALIAAANKLIKQAFAIAKSGQSYKENHVPEPV